MKITVFTPTYNRAYIIEMLYRSLQRQSFKNFEWLVIDDGSSDNTTDLVNGWIGENNFFPIRFFSKKNGGKYRAINQALDLAQGELFFIVDSDDYLADNALERIVFWESTIEDKNRFCGVMGNMGNSVLHSPNRPLGSEYRDITAFERYQECTYNVVDGERAVAWYTNIHKKYKYPEFEGEKFMTEAVTWNRMAHDGLLIRAFDEIICIFEYQDDGLTKSGSRLFINNPQGFGLWLREKAEFLNYNRKKKMQMWYTFCCDLELCDEENRVPIKKRAEYIGAPMAFMYCASFAHKAKQLLKGNRK